MKNPARAAHEKRLRETFLHARGMSIRWATKGYHRIPSHSVA